MDFGGLQGCFVSYFDRYIVRFGYNLGYNKVYCQCMVISVGNLSYSFSDRNLFAGSHDCMGIFAKYKSCQIS